MTTKEELINLFENNKGVFISGEEIAEKLSLSRTAIWKAVNGLRKDGYQIDAVPKKGYSLALETDIISAQGIKKYLDPICDHLQIDVLPTASSTNVLLREKASAGAPEGCCIVANNQTEGKGRVGRSFFSPADTGVYLSVLLRPAQCSARQAIKLTTMAAVAVCQAIDQVSNKNAEIKWVNDVFMNGKKVCGILTEASFGLENGSIEYAVLGIGVNVYPPSAGFPDQIANIAGTVFTQPQNDGKNRIAAAILNNFMYYYMIKENMDYVEQYRRRSFVIGKKINVLFPHEVKTATALDVDEDCRLIVRYEDGTFDCLSSGEVSLRLSRDQGSE